MNKKIVIPIGIGIAIIIVGIITIYNQESEILKSNDEINLENKTSENPTIDKKLNEIEKKAEDNYFKPAPRDWPTSGPFQIDRSEYLLGEKIFIRIGELELDDKGQMAFLRPLNDTHYSVYQTIQFDGSKKPAFNYYVSPTLSSILKICTSEELTGEWTIVFRGTEYENIKFKILDQVLPGEDYSPIC